MHRTTAAAGLIAAALLTAACSSSSPSTLPKEAPSPAATGTAACMAAIKDQYVPGTAQLKGEPSRPAACAGLSDDVVSEITLGVVGDNTQG